MICPESIRLEPSAICQLSCPLCPFRKQLTLATKGFMNYNDFYRLIKKNSEISKVDIAGRGEPFLNPDLSRIIQHAFAHNIAISFTGGTNLNDVSDETLESLVSCRILKLRCSIDGVTEETYRKYRVGGALKKVIRNLEKLNELKTKYKSNRPHLIFQFIIFRHNEHEIERAQLLAKLLNMQFLPRLNYSSTELSVNNRERIRHYLGYADRSEYLQGEKSSYFRNVCGQLWHNPQIAWNGDFLGCICNKWGAFDGNIFKHGLEKCYNGERITYARAMLMGKVPSLKNIPCVQCDFYKHLVIYQNWITEEEIQNKFDILLKKGLKKGATIMNLRQTTLSILSPTSVRIEACSLCQLSCVLCPAALGETDKIIGKGYLKFENFKEFIDLNPQIRRIELGNFGEVFLNPDLPSILRYANEKMVITEIDEGSNLNDVTDECIEAMIRYKTTRLRCAIDGISQETYQQYRVGGNLKKVIRNIEKINQIKKAYQSETPHLIFQFILFGHNEHEVKRAVLTSKMLNMEICFKLNFSPNGLPVRNHNLVRQTIGYIDRAEYLKKTGRHYQRHQCYEMWLNPQINWDGKILGCSRNFWGHYGSGAFKQNLAESMNNQDINHAREALMGKTSHLKDAPCLKCGVFKAMLEYKNWITKEELYQAHLKGQISTDFNSICQNNIFINR
ncbi:MAG: radical SAM protein [Desulfamplus sp.]|nr:radical SAM protein [Desulfamplus sp.]